MCAHDQQRSYHGTTLQLVQPGVPLTPEFQYESEMATAAAGTDMEMTTLPPQSPPSSIQECNPAFTVNKLT